MAAGEKRILLCGIVGSRQGWAEAKYLSCPVGIADLAASVVELPLPGAEVLLVPGVIGKNPDGVPEVMRGEETEAMGMSNSNGGPALVCLPGTHSKWIHLDDRTIVSFITCMTGEVFGALRKCTILARIMTSDATVDNAAFVRGIARSADSGGLLHHLFSVRTLARDGPVNGRNISVLSLRSSHRPRSACCDAGWSPCSSNWCHRTLLPLCQGD